MNAIIRWLVSNVTAAAPPAATAVASPAPPSPTDSPLSWAEAGFCTVFTGTPIVVVSCGD